MTIIISIGILCLTLVGLLGLQNWKEVQIRQVELALKAIEHEEWKAKRLN